MSLSLLLAVVLVALTRGALPSGHQVLEGDVCRVDGLVGRCIHFRANPTYLRLMLKVARTEEEDEHLRRHICERRSGLTCRLGPVNEEGCGVQMDDRIVGGQRAALDQYPWMALLQYVNHRKGTKRFACGGALLSRRFVLSAAHCFARLPSGFEFHKVRLGEWDTESEVDCEEDAGDDACAPPVQDFGYEQVIVHDRYTGSSADRTHDIALVKLDGAAEYGAFVRPICLPEPGSDGLLFGAMWAAGWGRTETESGSRYKLFVQLDHHELAGCNGTYATKLHIPLADSQFCAIGQPGKDTCNGDSGGPLMKVSRAVHYVVGIVSFGPQKCGSPLPAVYTRVDKFYEWIVTQMVVVEN